MQRGQPKRRIEINNEQQMGKKQKLEKVEKVEKSNNKIGDKQQQRAIIKQRNQMIIKSSDDYAG